jgi:hypothetical protein
MLKKIISVLGLVAMLIGAGISGIIGKLASRAIFSPSEPNKEELIEQLTIAADKINRQLPMMVDSETRLDRATVGPGVRTVYHYKILNYTSKNIDIDRLQTYLRPQVVKSVCSNKDMKASLQYGVKYDYIYAGNDGIEITQFEIAQNDCTNDVLSTQAAQPTTDALQSLPQRKNDLVNLYKAAELGDAEAQFELGVMYGTGDGAPLDYDKSLYWYSRAEKTRAAKSH